MVKRENQKIVIKKKVVHISTVHPPFDTRIFHKQAKTLVAAGYEVTLIVQHDKAEQVEGIDIIPLPKPRNRFSRVFGLSWRSFGLARRQKGDIYHFHDPELIPVGILLKIVNRSRVIYDVHEDVSKQILTKGWIPSFLRKLVAKFYSGVEKIAARLLDGVITATEDIARNFIGYNPVVIHNYPRLEMLPKARNHSKHQNEGETTLVYVGGLTKNRGIRETVLALGFLNEDKKVKFQLIGKFQDRDFKEEIQNMPEYKDVLFMRWQDPPAVYNSLRNSDVGIVCLSPLPRYRVALPVKLFEYMAAGLPVIASDFPIWRDIVKGNSCGIMVDPESPKEIAEAIDYLIENPKEAEIMGKNGRKAVEEKYNWANEERKLLRLYQSILGK